LLADGTDWHRKTCIAISIAALTRQLHENRKKKRLQLHLQLHIFNNDLNVQPDVTCQITDSNLSSEKLTAFAAQM